MVSPVQITVLLYFQGRLDRYVIPKMWLIQELSGPRRLRIPLKYERLEWM